MCFSIVHFFIKNSNEYNVTNESDFLTLFLYHIALSIEGYKHGLRGLKPVLSCLLHSILYTFTLETFASLFFNLLMGNRLLLKIVNIPGLRSNKLDCDRSIAKKLLLPLLAIILAINITTLLLFNYKNVVIVLNWIFNPSETFPNEDESETKRLIIALSFTLFCYGFQSIISILFIYIMLIFEKNIRIIAKTVKNNVTNIDEHFVYQINHQLFILSKHFHEIIGQLSIPLTILNITTILLLIGSSCLMLVESLNNNTFKTFHFNFGSFAFIRIIVTCTVGNLVTNAYEDLIITLYDQIPKWSTKMWIYFNEIKRMKRRFRVIIFNFYSIRQSSILTLLSFALSYIVVLLQTENL